MDGGRHVSFNISIFYVVCYLLFDRDQFVPIKRNGAEDEMEVFPYHLFANHIFIEYQRPDKFN